MVIESDPPCDPHYIQQLEDDFRRLILESILPEKSPDPSTRQPHAVFRLPPELLGTIFATVCHADFHKFHSDKILRIGTTRQPHLPLAKFVGNGRGEISYGQRPKSGAISFVDQIRCSSQASRGVAESFRSLSSISQLHFPGRGGLVE